MATTPVRWFHSGMSGAPVLSGAAGSLIQLLDACLIDGFDTKTINSISVAAGVATVTISAGHSYDVHAVVRIAGVTGALSALNDDWRLTSAGASTFTFACPGIADGSAAGTMTAKRSPAGWAKPYAATNKGVYQSQNLAATRLYLRADDTAPNLAAVRGYESLTDIDTGTNLFPTIAQLAATSFHWARSSTSDGTARPWSLFADDCALYFLPEYHAGYPSNPQFYGFGDLVKLAPSDAYHAFIFGCAAAAVQIPTNGVSSSNLGGTSGSGTFIARAASQAVGALANGRVGSMISLYFGQSAPNISTSPDGNVHLHAPILALDGSGVASAPIRGAYPGIIQPLQAAPVAHRTVIDGEGAFAGRAIMFNNVVAATTASPGRIAIDITGPWR